MARFFRTGFRTDLLENWLPALDGMIDRLAAGARVADIGCGHGHALVLMAEAFPRSTFVGYDFHEGSVAAARAHAAEHGVSDRVTFEVATAKAFPGRDFDLIAFFDTLHDLGDPVGATAHVRQALASDGTLMVVEPQAADRLEDNINPVGRLFYGGSTMICVPASLAQETGRALGAQAGESELTSVLHDGGFQQRPTRCRRTVQHGAGSPRLNPERARGDGAQKKRRGVGRPAPPFRRRYEVRRYCAGCSQVPHCGPR